MPEFTLSGTIDVSSHTLLNVNITIDEAILLNNQYNADDIRNLNIPECLYENKGPHGNCTFQLVKGIYFYNICTIVLSSSLKNIFNFYSVIKNKINMQ
uniref:Recep_L_domain domain-containing protein n=1 Tax=Heterorhabditis bacteriophora TaxID=37862 RepID=A0A1I7WZY7_HETBA